MNMFDLMKVAIGFFIGRQIWSRRAGLALMVALALPVIIGTSGFTVDAGLWFAQQTAMQTATDAAAVKDARDLATNAATPPSVLSADAVSAANIATGQQFNITSSMLTERQLTDQRQVQVDATMPGSRFFSQLFYPAPVFIHTSSTAGVAYTTISTQATCYGVDAETYLYSTGFGTVDTAHSSGIDPFKCGTPPSPPAAYDAYCGGGVLGCSLDLLNAGNFLLPFAFQIGPNGGGGGLSPILGTVTQTLSGMLGANSGGGGSPTVLGPGSPQCPANVCTVTAGTYNGGLTIKPGVSIAFVASGGNDTFLIQNGDLDISTQDTLAANSDPNAVFYMGGAHPGGYVAATQIQLNTAPINNGAIVLTSKSTFKSNSLIGTQTSAPISVMPYAQAAALSSGLLSILGLPGQNLVGTNFVSAVGVCANAVSTCTSPQGQSSQTQSTVVPAISALSSLLSLLNLTSIPLVDLLSNEGETSVSTITSGVTIANGVPTDWKQQEAVTSTLTNTVQTVPSVLASLGVSGLTAVVASPLVSTLLNAIAPNETMTQNASGSGVVTGQTSGGTPSCTGQTVLYSTTITPSYEPGFSDILQAAGQYGAGGAVATTDTITVCGNSTVATITPIAPGQILVASTAGGSSALSLLK
jgi:Flp pilus assembly protein TadG